MRTGRTDGTNTYSYVYNGSKLSRMTYNGIVMNFTYDAAGTPLTIEYNGTLYYYVTNLQGDVVGILDGSGNLVVQYFYNAWGYIMRQTGSLSSTLGNQNPLRYRGYVYDHNMGLYYLESRYYNPGLGRFQNADAFVSTGQGFLGNNMYIYCNNNPVNMYDPSGNLPRWIESTVNWLKDNIVQPINEFFSDISEDITNYEKDNDNVERAYESNYFSSYKGTLVLRHTSSILTSWSFAQAIVLNHNLDDTTLAQKTDTLNHEYGHILQEKEMGTPKFLFVVAIPSVTTNVISRFDENVRANYYNMPWEYDADVRGNVDRTHSWWAGYIADYYFVFWGGR